VYGYGYTFLGSIGMGGTSLDPDAAAFLTAAGITDPTQQSAINTLVVSLKSYGIWSKMKAIYPFIGGTSTTHKYNLKDPRDLDAAFRLSFTGGWTHSANGVKPNGTNAYANTYLFSNSITSAHLSVYSRENISNGLAIDIGAVTSAADRYWLAAGFTSNNDIVLGFGNSLRTSSGSAQGFFTGTLNGTTSTLLKNGSQLSTGSTFIGALPSNIPLYVGGSSGVSTYSNRQLAFSSVGDYLNNTEAANLYTAVQTFNTTLNRQV